MYHIEEIMQSYGLDCQVVRYAESTRTAQEAADAIGCDVAHIVKSLVFMTTQTHQPILVLTSGINRVNETSLAQIVGEPIGKADADFVRKTTGYAIGGVAPFGHSQKIMTFMDQSLLEYPVVWAAAGTPHTVFSINSADLERIAEAQIITV